MDEFEYKGFKYRIVSVVDSTVELIYAGKLTGKVVVPEEVEYQNLKYKVVGIRGARKIEYSYYQPDDKRRKLEKRRSDVYFPVFVGKSLQSFQDKLEVVLPKSLKKIGCSAFYNCYNLVSVNIPVGVTSIGDYVFHYCDALTSITIPNSVTSIGERAFYRCGALTSVTIENEEGKVKIWYDAFPDKAKITYVGKPKEQPAKPTEKAIAQAKPEAPKATTQANPSLLAKLLKIVKSIFHSSNKK